MWSLFPQTSSSNLNNNLYLPPPPAPAKAAPGIREPRERASAEPRGPWLHRGPARARALPQTPEARRGSTRGNRRGAGGWARARPLAARRVACLLSPAPGPCSGSRASPAAAAPHVTSGQIQRDVLLAAVIPPCAKQTHNPS